MTDEQLVEVGRKAVRTLQWNQMLLGNLAMEYAPVANHRGGADRGVGDRLKEYADKIGMDWKTLKIYRAVAHAWREHKHAQDRPFTALRVLSAAKDKDEALALIDKGMSKPQLVEEARKLNILPPPPVRKDNSTQVKLKKALALLNEVEVEREDIKMLNALHKKLTALQKQAEKPKLKAA